MCAYVSRLPTPRGARRTFSAVCYSKTVTAPTRLKTRPGPTCTGARARRARARRRPSRRAVTGGDRTWNPTVTPRAPPRMLTRTKAGGGTWSSASRLDPNELSCSLADASIAETAAANDDRLAASPYRDHTGLPASLRMKKCFLRASHRGSSSRSSGRPREGCHRQKGLGGRDDDAESRAEPARREASADASPPAMPCAKQWRLRWCFTITGFHRADVTVRGGAVWSRNVALAPPDSRPAPTPLRSARAREPTRLAQPSPRRIALRAPDPVVRPKASARQPVVGARSDLGTASQI